jgi:glycosyltransferase involved in cell wall biosynthesis
MSNVAVSARSAMFEQTEVVLETGGRFSFSFDGQFAFDSHGQQPQLNLVIDVYDLDSPVHPDGHLGWWRYQLEELARRPGGQLSIAEDGIATIELDHARPLDCWRNDKPVHANRLLLLLVLRSSITNAIVAIERVPVLRSQDDLASFRATVLQGVDTPHYTPPQFILPSMTRACIVARNIFPRDAVGNLCVDLYRMLRQQGTDVLLFADDFDLAMNDVIRRQERLADHLTPDDTIVYFFSTYDDDLARISRLTCKRKIAYFHGVTAPKLLQVFDPELSVVCAKAIAQIPLLAGFDLLAANSAYNAAQLQAIAGTPRSAPAIRVISPVILREDRAVPVEAEPTSTCETSQPTTLLFVGRIKSHKRIEDLLHLLAEYRKLDPTARCTIVGHSDNTAYRDYLDWVQHEQLKLTDDAVAWAGSLADDELRRVYRDATVYISMSEDEGFNIPLFEAMQANLLVFAYALPAVRETLGSAGLLFEEKSMAFLAQRLHRLLQHPASCASIREGQRARAQELARSMTGAGFFEILAGVR